jgi:DNA-binding beta-propeller fold protein YncE
VFLSSYGGGLSLYRPRGLARGDDGSLYIADTGRNRVVRLSETGDQQAVVPEGWEARPAVIDQPTSAVQGGNIIYVTEPTRARLHRLTPDGRAAAPAWAMQGTDTLRSARLTLGPKNEVVLAEVGAGRVALICAGGGRVLAWRPERGGDPRAAALGPDGALFVVDSEGTLTRVRLAEGC